MSDITQPPASGKRGLSLPTGGLREYERSCDRSTETAQPPLGTVPFARRQDGPSAGPAEWRDSAPEYAGVHSVALPTNSLNETKNWLASFLAVESISRPPSWASFPPIWASTS